MNVRAKFRCTNRTTTKYGSQPEHEYVVYEFAAIYDETTPENQRFAKATPSGSLKIQVDNPGVSFEPGKFYYLDFTPAD